MAMETCDAKMGREPMVGARDAPSAALTGVGRQVELKALSWSGCAAILATYSVSSSTAFMPFIFGRLGFLSAPVMLGLHFALCGWLQQQVLTIALQRPEAHNMPALAEAVAGGMGRKAFQFLQIANQQLFMPCALLFVIKALKQVTLAASPDGYVRPAEAPGVLSCNVTWIFIVMFAALVGVNLQRRFGHASNLCKVTCALNVLQVCLIIARVLLNPRDHEAVPAPGVPSHHGMPKPWPAFPLSSEASEQSYWVDVFTALSSFCYCYVPCFIATEAMQELGVKTDVNKALWSSTLGMYLLYFVVGLGPVLAWGWRRDYEVLAELQADFFGRSANFMLMIASGMDFLITAISLNQRLQEAIDPGFNPNDWSTKACARWFVFSLPSLVVSFLMLCFIPDLNSLVGLMTAFVVPFTQIIGPAILTIMASRKGILGRQLNSIDWVLLLAGCCLGAGMLVVGGSSTIYSIFFSGPLVKGDFFCEAVAG